MRDNSTKFPNSIDDRIFAQDINIEQVPIMNDYYMFLNSGNYDRATELLNNSDVFFYGAWTLNLLENRLCAIGDYVMQLEKPTLVINSDKEPTNIWQGMCWIADEDMMEYRDDFLHITDINMYFGDVEPTDSSMSLNDTWISNGETTTTKVDKNDVNILYQGFEPTSVSNKYDLWIGDE